MAVYSLRHSIRYLPLKLCRPVSLHIVIANVLLSKTGFLIKLWAPRAKLTAQYNNWTSSKISLLLAYSSISKCTLMFRCLVSKRFSFCWLYQQKQEWIPKLRLLVYRVRTSYFMFWNYNSFGCGLMPALPATLGTLMMLSSMKMANQKRFSALVDSGFFEIADSIIILKLEKMFGEIQLRPWQGWNLNSDSSLRRIVLRLIEDIPPCGPQKANSIKSCVADNSSQVKLMLSPHNLYHLKGKLENRWAEYNQNTFVLESYLRSQSLQAS